jgi:hypothetical protein
MKAPKRLLISPFDYKIIYDQDRVKEHDADGIHVQHRQEIVIGKDQAHEMERDALLHETVHACFAQTPMFENNEEGYKHEERVVQALTPRLLALLRNNPEFVKYLMEGVE